MGKIVMSRVDARLVHGQVAARWTSYLRAKKIVVIDNDTSKDKFLIDLFRLAAPPGAKVIVYDEEKGLEAFNKDQFGAGPIFIVIKTVDAAKRLFDNGLKITSLNIGQSPKNEERKQIHNTVHLSDAEVDKLIEMSNQGVNVYFQPTPEERAVQLKDVLKKIK